ncbi:hypothetical protein OQY15_10145 [Pedobacter sp. MC2016-15]|uniref:hypothetical protein n=1 Tax=Pedobacter sp. MC2016-15 TaxID=2994473 RepID=UPI0022474296|nr:hypothetical protein [Pedobacter sp. MC2016-15]MCX2479450.1 hypothetical protein [Pedobacter sp. MC2016-15]
MRIHRVRYAVLLILNLIIVAGISSAQAPAAKDSNPPIAIPFTLKVAGYVTLVVENQDGVRVRNLVSDTWYNAGNNTAWWDGLDDLGRDVEATHHGVYHIPAKFVAPGTYKVRGLVHEKIKTSYEFSVYTTGNPPWSTNDHTGGWLANHTPPQAALFVPAAKSPAGQPVVMLGSYITEGPDGLAWVDLDGKKLGGKKWVGGAWTAAPYLAADAGATASTGIYAYVASVWETAKQSGEAELRITGLTAKADKKVLLQNIGLLKDKADKKTEMTGFAVSDGTGVISLFSRNQLLLADLSNGKTVSTSELKAPRGLAFDKDKHLLVLSGNQLLKFNSVADLGSSAAPQVLISKGLEAPVAVTLDAAGNLYISDGGNSHQVKVFSAKGSFIRAIGKPGAPKAGLYDELHMNNPAGITIDEKQQLWVTENDFLPKRVSVWSLDGKLLKAFYGPAKYGGGGAIDPVDKNKFYYGEESLGAMEFELDWTKGSSKLKRILYRSSSETLPLPSRSGAPETVLYSKGKRYFTNCYNSNPTSGNAVTFIFAERNGVTFPAAAMGRADQWDLLKEERFKKLLPAGVDLNAKNDKALAYFIWVDLNADAQVQPEELNFEKGNAMGVTVMKDLSFCIAQLDGKAVQFPVDSWTSEGVPVYQSSNRKILAEGLQPSASSGGNQVLAAANGWTVALNGILPFNRYSLSGAKNGKAMWSYPNLWPGLHASHEAPIPSFPGQLIGTTHLLGGLMESAGAGIAELWAVNSNHGMVYIFTSDGLFVTTLFEPMRTGKRWQMPAASRGMSLEGLSLAEENFWPTITQLPGGEVYLVDGGRSSIVKVDGLQSLREITATSIIVKENDLDKSRLFLAGAENARQQGQRKKTLRVDLHNKPLLVDGKFDDWTGADWAEIDQRGVKANFNSNSKPYDIKGAIAVAGDRLFLAYETGNASLLKNSGEMPAALFKTGGALDLMISSDPAAKSDRKMPVAGDQRLLVTLIKGKPRALLYRAIVSGVKEADKVPFTSPLRTVTFDQVEDISDKIQFAAGKNGEYEVSVPLALLNLKPAAGIQLKGDIGILRGEEEQTVARVYWMNKATGIVSDVPSEAELTPALWGTLNFEGTK